MKPEEIETIIKTLIEKEKEYYWIFLIISIILSLLTVYLFQFLKEKAGNHATKQDIEDITKKIEDVKASIQNQQEVEKQKRQLKYDALLHSLVLIDANLSHSFPNTTKQYATAEEVRKCHSSLILTCENTEVLEMFSLIIFGPENSVSNPIPPTDQLNIYRNLVRKELGFGSEIPLDRNRAWCGCVIFEKDGTNPS